MTNSPPNDERVFREALRRRLIAAREAMTEEARTRHSSAIVGHLDALLAALQPARLAFCWPYRGEFDARELVAKRLASGLVACLPVVVDSKQPLEFRAWTPESVMQAGRYDIPVPQAGAPVTPEAILMPLNAFDNAGYRLGYGGGYFDRSLARLTPRPIAIGIGFELARVDSIQPHEHDQPMDYIVTEAGAFAVGEGGLRRLKDKSG